MKNYYLAVRYYETDENRNPVGDVKGYVGTYYCLHETANAIRDLPGKWDIISIKIDVEK